MPRYAVNICDMAYPELATPAQFMLAPVCAPREIVTTSAGRIDSDAVVLQCEESQAQAVCDFLARAGKERGRLVRTYEEGARKGWKERKRA